jgi:2-(1,2-epoxy-1,2-dihydrophenyl)acetyl-CoA isomerase
VTNFRSLEKPVICALNGVAAGAGATVSLSCDLRIASDRASFVFAAFLGVGLIPDGGGTYFLTQLVGVSRALELAMLNDSKNRLNPDQALQWGLVNRVVPHDDLLAETMAIARRLAQMPTRAIGLAKRAVYKAGERSLAEALEYEAQLQTIAGGTHDHREGVAAFLEKREPVFKGE